MFDEEFKKFMEDSSTLISVKPKYIDSPYFINESEERQVTKDGNPHHLIDKMNTIRNENSDFIMRCDSDFYLNKKI